MYNVTRTVAQATARARGSGPKLLSFDRRGSHNISNLAGARIAVCRLNSRASAIYLATHNHRLLRSPLPPWQPQINCPQSSDVSLPTISSLRATY
jgi:hypothetical protein